MVPLGVASGKILGSLRTTRSLVVWELLSTESTPVSSMAPLNHWMSGAGIPVAKHRITVGKVSSTMKVVSGTGNVISGMTDGKEGVQGYMYVQPSQP